MENRRRIAANRGMEENIMAILDCCGSRDSLHHQNADRIAFLDAVRSACVVPEDGPPPTSKMFEAIFDIFRDTTTSLELVMTSYQLLIELEKNFPRVYRDETNPNELIVTEEAWSPFAIATEFLSSEKHMSKGKSSGPLGALEFNILLEGVAQQLECAKETHPRDIKTTQLDHLGYMLLFHYLVYVLEGDFWPRNSVFIDTSNWISLKESLLNLLLASRQINYKAFVNNCLAIISTPFPTLTTGEGGSAANEALTYALPQAGKSTQKAVNKLLVMIMELDVSRKIADVKGLMTRKDGVRTSTMEIIVDQLTYEKVDISSFLQGLDKPKLKLDIVLQYFHKYNAKPSVRTRRSDDSMDDPTIFGVLKRFANASISKNIIKKIGVDIIQLLLAHTLQACLALSNQELIEVVFNSKAGVSSSPLKEVSNNIAIAFKSIRSIDKSMEIIPLGKEALFAAATILTSS
ncbi:hypothetical protein V2J09_000450 [Rumex salicifolius]